MNASLNTGTILNKGAYSIISVVGIGGFGITYLAKNTITGEKVAIKEFFPSFFCTRESDTSTVKIGVPANIEIVNKLKKQFLRESLHLVSMNHLGIVKIHSSFEENNTAYYVMDYIKGESLSAKVKNKGPLSLDQSIKYIKIIGETLKYLHQHHFNHLDVKPANIMIRDIDNYPILIDFGLSVHFTPDGDLTNSMPVGLSHGFAPIEQYHEEGVKQFSPWSDIYSLGATFYYLITGKIPPQAIIRHSDRLSYPLSFPKKLIPVIEKSMALNKKNRYQTIDEFLYDLNNFQYFTDPIVEYKTNEDGITTMIIGNTWDSNNPNTSTQTYQDDPNKQNNVSTPQNATSSSSTNPAIVNTGKPNTASNKNSGAKTFWICLVVFCIIGLFAYFDNNSNNKHEERVTVSPPTTPPQTPIKTPNNGPNGGPQDSAPLQENKLEAPVKRTFSINEPHYSGTFNLTASDGKVVVKYNINGMGAGSATYMYRNNTCSANKAIDQVEGLIYWDAASQLAYEGSENSDEFLIESAIKLLKKSYMAFSIDRGNSPTAFSGAKSRHDMLKKAYNSDDEQRFNEYEIISYGMGENEIMANDVKFVN